VKNVLFLDPHNCLVSVDLAGKMYFWATTPSRIRNTLLIEIFNVVISATGEDDYCPIRTLVFEEEMQILFTGDDNGNIRKWNLANMLAKLAAAGTLQAKIMADSEESKRGESPGRSPQTFLTSTNLVSPAT
jgi:hypothetical protein